MKFAPEPFGNVQFTSVESIHVVLQLTSRASSPVTLCVHEITAPHSSFHSP